LLILGTRSGIKVSSMLSLLNTLLTILLPSLAGKGLTIGAGGGSHRGIELCIKSDAAARWAVGPLEFISDLLI
jgi:hypothetical protein